MGAAGASSIDGVNVRDLVVVNHVLAPRVGSGRDLAVAKAINHVLVDRGADLGVVAAALRARFRAERSLEPPSTSGVVWNFAPTISGGSHMGITSLDVSATYTKGVRPAVRAVLTSDLR